MRLRLFILIAAAITMGACVHQVPKKSWTYFGQFPKDQDVEKVVIEMPGDMLSGTEVATGTKIPVYAFDQAKLLGNALAKRGLDRYIPQALCGQRNSSGELQGDTDEPAKLTLSITRPGEGSSHSVVIEIPATERLVDVSNGNQYRLFTLKQAQIIFDQLKELGYDAGTAASMITVFAEGRHQIAKKE